MIAGPHAHTGRNRVVGIVVFYGDITRRIHQDTGVIIMWPGVDDTQTGHGDVALVGDMKQAKQIVRQRDAAAVNRGRLAGVGGVGDGAARAA